MHTVTVIKTNNKSVFTKSQDNKNKKQNKMYRHLFHQLQKLYLLILMYIILTVGYTYM